MLTAYPIKSAAVAADYYCAAAGGDSSGAVDYYAKEGEGHWLGKGAEALGLEGAVEKEAFRAVLEGRLPNGEVLGRVTTDGEIGHRPGTGVTFSAPKSVSIAALVSGDDRILEAEKRVIERMVGRIEELAATARDKSMETEGQAHATDNIIAAAFQESMSKAGEPDLHTHLIVANATQTEDGQWRSTQERAIFSLQKKLGEEYRMELAAELQALGYQIRDLKLSDGSYGFEVAGVPREVLDHFSSRSRQIEEYLAAQGLTRETASPEQIQAAANATRRDAADGAEIAGPAQRAAWQAQAKAMGFDTQASVLESKIQQPEPETMAQARREAAHAAVAAAVEHLSERETRFGKEELLDAAKRFAAYGAADAAGNRLPGKPIVADLREAIRDMRREGALIERQARAFDPRTRQKETVRGFTTAAGVQVEQRMLASVARMSAGGTAITTRAQAAEAIKRQEAATGYAFNPGQREAAMGILTDQSRIHIVQGYAGTAKTTSVLAAVADEARRQGIEVKALAPTGSAAQILGKELSADASTVARHLNTQGQEAAAPKRELWIVDEFGMLGTRDAQRLIQTAERASAVLVATGDMHQLGSVPAGAAFRQIQEAGAKVHEITEIVRQRDEQLKESVYHAIKGEAAAMLKKIEQSAGGTVIEINGGGDKSKAVDSQRDRYERLADIYVNQSPEKRADSVIVEPSKEGRAVINEAVRERLQRIGDLAGPATTVQALAPKDLTEVQARVADSYAVGDVLLAGRRYESLGLNRDDLARVVAVDTARNRITIETGEGQNKKEIEINPGNYVKLHALETREIRIQKGDKLIMRGADLTTGLKNGTALDVVKVDPREIHVKDVKGKVHKLDAKKHLQIDHGYALTGPQAQGLTRSHAIVHLESHRKNLVTQQLSYVGASRATREITVVTDDRQRLIQQIQRESGQKQTAMEMRPPAPAPKIELSK